MKVQAVDLEDVGRLKNGSGREVGAGIELDDEAETGIENELGTGGVEKEERMWGNIGVLEVLKDDGAVIEGLENGSGIE